MTAPTDLARLEQGCTSAEAAAIYDGLETVRAENILGRWRGSEVRTGHPLDGLLEASGWYGKDFVDLETVHPLLFQDSSGTIFAVDPRKVPMDLAELVPRSKVVGRAIAFARFLVGTKEPRARLRNVDYRGKVSAAMVYDHLPIIDAFRRLTDDVLLGAMDRRGDAQPYYFLIRRVR